jgi:2-polyprenyl-6-methoxyphenol hydroxylase-like FAD-dependent oxidoreductase
MATGERALIVGGSIAGLTAAHGLRGAGFDVKAFEVAPELWDVGTGIQLWVNAMSALEGLGIAEAVREVARPAEGTQLRSWRGSTGARRRCSPCARC